jgi:hypothetical protein
LLGSGSSRHIILSIRDEDDATGTLTFAIPATVMTLITMLIWLLWLLWLHPEFWISDQSLSAYWYPSTSYWRIPHSTLDPLNSFIWLFINKSWLGRWVRKPCWPCKNEEAYEDAAAQIDYVDEDHPLQRTDIAVLPGSLCMWWALAAAISAWRSLSICLTLLCVIYKLFLARDR